MSASARVGQIAGHLASYPQGLLKDEVAIITGAAQGIGRSCALKFAKEGAKVAVVDLDEKKAQAVVTEIEAMGGQAIAIQADVTSLEFPKKVVKATIDAFGDINHCINNAGFTFDKMLHTMAPEAFQLILNVHVTAPFLLIREAAPYFRTKDPQRQKVNRSIIQVSSVSGLHGNAGQINYAAAKAAVIGMTKTVAKEWGVFGVRANTVAFGYIETRLTGDKALGEAIEVGGQKIALGIPNMGGSDGGRIPDIPLGRPGSADEAANAVLFLASPLASYISGHTLEVTGGKGI